MRKYLLCAVAAGAVIAGAGSAFADEAAAQKWIDQEFQPSVLSKDVCFLSFLMVDCILSENRH